MFFSMDRVSPKLDSEGNSGTAVWECFGQGGREL